MLGFYVGSVFVVFQGMSGEPIELYQIPTIMKFK
jgi:hypothetical protein